MMKLDLINREDLLNSIDHFVHPNGEITKDSLTAMINILPQYQHTHYSKWIVKDGLSGFFCDDCGGSLYAKTPYCPFCNAKMIERDADECD